MEKIDLKKEVKKLPTDPGVYIMKNSTDEIIYIGKAKNLKNRVSSYFVNSSSHSEKVKKMVSNIHHFEYIVTDSEFEALVLECSLIKKHKPKYNILLKDDKGFSYIKITNEKWPKVLYVKQKENDKSIYIGPYTDSFSVKKTVAEMNKIFKLPTCNRNLNKPSKRPCLNYYIKRCCAPCIRAIPNQEYNNLISQAIKFARNGSKETLHDLNNQMKKASENLEFEKAASLRDRIKALENMQRTQKVVANKIKNQDIIACAQDEKFVCFEIFRFENGDLRESKSFIVEPEDNLKSTRTEFIERYYQSTDTIPKHIVIDGQIENEELIKEYFKNISGHSVNFLIPKRGEQFKLLEMCRKNAEESLLRTRKNKNKLEDTLEEIKNILKLKSIPNFIEAYDISNTMGSDNVGGMVVYKHGKPFKKGYKRFKINSITGQDDYGSIKEVLARRITEYNQHKNDPENTFGHLPDLILIDGGKTHTKAATDVLKAFNLAIPTFGMVKDSKHRTRAITDEGSEINIKSYSRAFNFITGIQDEVHRFAINYHKNLRNKKITNSRLTEIPGVGKTRAKILLKKFKTIQNISNASLENLESTNGITKNIAKNVFDFFNNPEN